MALKKEGNTRRLPAGTTLLSAALVTLLMAAGGLSTAYAQSSASVRVSNLEQPVGMMIPIRGSELWAQSFCTGDVASILARVRMYTAFVDWTFDPIRITDSSGFPVVTIRSDNAGEPDTVLHTLGNPTFDTDLGTAEDFTSSGYALLPSTRYWLTVEGLGSSPFAHFFIGGTSSTEEDPGTDLGWAIGDRALANIAGSWREVWPINMRMAVFASLDAPTTTSPFPLDSDCDGASGPFRLPVAENQSPGEPEARGDAGAIRWRQSPQGGYTGDE